MCMEDKCRLLNELLEPFGYCYDLKQDIFSTRMDAWQRKFGYCALYDNAAEAFQMVFDCMPVYFNYRGRTWLIEFWKGQYGINAGCEIGVYYADGIVEEEKWSSTLFQCVEDEDLQILGFSLYRKGSRLAHLRCRHWWLTAFDPGAFFQPEELFMDASLTLENCEMARAFAEGLVKAGYDKEDIWLNDNTVSLSFMTGTMQYGFFRKLRRSLAQVSNRFGCFIYRFATRPLQLSVDRVLYLYFYLPFAFRRLFHDRRFKTRKQFSFRKVRL